MVGKNFFDKIVKLVEGKIIPPEKKKRNNKQLNTIIIKMEHHKISKLLNNSSNPHFRAKTTASATFQVNNAILLASWHFGYKLQHQFFRKIKVRI